MAILTGAIEVVAVDTGLWCRTCALSSGIRVWFVTRTGPAMTMRSTLGCMDCDSRDIAEA
jgi:hypothetical protein